MSAAVATIIVSVVTVAGALLTVRMQRQIHDENRDDHGQTATKVDELLVGQREFRADVRDIKMDVRELRAASRQHDKRIDDLEETP